MGERISLPSVTPDRTGCASPAPHVVHFERLVQILSPGERDLVASIEAYFDDSGCHDGSPALTVAGFVFERDHAIALNREWTAVLDRHGLPFFHMVDCAHGNAHFARFSKPDRVAIQSELQGILYRHAALGFAVAINELDFERWFCQSKRFLPNAFSLCCYVCLVCVREWIVDQKHSLDKVSIFFEAGNKHEAEAVGLMNRIFGEESSVSRNFVSKRIGGGPIQAADMLAWLNYNFIKRIGSNNPRPRADLQAIIDNVDCIGTILDKRMLVNLIDIGLCLPKLAVTTITSSYDGERFKT